MSDQIFTSSEQDQIEALARRRGFKTLREYMRALIDQDAVQHGEALPLDDEFAAEQLGEGIRQGLREALRGEYVSLETLWSDDDE
ncbi:MAG: hypothetical protein IT319_01970 [Anaerolineae bacterium]|nr:hypothetical protein [Anaerolineae bacterium]